MHFEEVLDHTVAPVYEDLSGFLHDNSFKVSMPMNEKGRRSYKFELAENAYLLVIFRFAGVDEYELRNETFIPGHDPILEKFAGRVGDIDREWTESLFRAGLDRFVDSLAGINAEQPEELVAV